MTMTMTMTVNREEGALSWKQYELSEFRQKRKFDLTRSMEGGRSGTRGKKIPVAYVCLFDFILASFSHNCSLLEI